MIPIQMPVVERFRKVVQATQTAILAQLQAVNSEFQQLHYDHGHGQEIVNRLTQMNLPQQSQYLKYPLVALIQDFTENNQSSPTRFPSAPVRIIIANETTESLSAAERYDQNFKPILLPIYEELMRQIAKSPYFINPSTPRHDKIDRIFWGKEGVYGNLQAVANDLLDAVEIRNLELIIPRGLTCGATGFSKNF